VYKVVAAFIVVVVVVVVVVVRLAFARLHISIAQG
jgi:hypothetical protein